MQTRRAFIPAGRLIAYLLAAAVIVGVFVAFKMRTKSIEEGEPALSAPAAAELSRYLTEEHRAAVANPTLLQGGGMRDGATADSEKLRESSAQWLGTQKTLEDLFGERKAPAFVGARKSSVPGVGPSMQMLFKTGAGGADGGMASIFLKKYMEAPKQDDNTSLSLKGEGLTMVLWRRGGVVYQIVGPPQAAEALRTALDAAAPAGDYPGT
jgi:hypothetical protein